MKNKRIPAWNLDRTQKQYLKFNNYQLTHILKLRAQLAETLINTLKKECENEYKIYALDTYKVQASNYLINTLKKNFKQIEYINIAIHTNKEREQ